MASALLGKNSAFLNSFWDLASDETAKRVAAAQAIVSHVGGATGGDDAEYALKRLVRGLGSSRESARQGFVTCLTALLVAAPAVPTATVLALIDEHTKVTGSLKGAEERDFMFGKLFGYLALARSGRLDGVPLAAHAGAVVDGLLELHARKGWMREVATEALLVVLAAVRPATVVAAGLIGKVTSGWKYSPVFGWLLTTGSFHPCFRFRPCWRSLGPCPCTRWPPGSSCLPWASNTTHGTPLRSCLAQYPLFEVSDSRGVLV